MLFRSFILHVHLSLVDVRAGLEGYGDRRRAIGVAGRRHIEQALYAIQLLLDHLSDILLQRRRVRPGICRPDREGRGRNRWILLNRKGLKRKTPGQNDHKRPRSEERSVGKEWSGPGSLQGSQ